MSKKDALVDETGLPVEAEVVETPEVEQTEVVETEVVEEKTSSKYPKVPKGEGVDPLTAGPKIPNIDSAK